MLKKLVGDILIMKYMYARFMAEHSEWVKQKIIGTRFTQIKNNILLSFLRLLYICHRMLLECAFLPSRRQERSLPGNIDVRHKGNEYAMIRRESIYSFLHVSNRINQVWVLNNRVEQLIRKRRFPPFKIYTPLRHAPRKIVKKSMCVKRKFDHISSYAHMLSC